MVEKKGRTTVYNKIVGDTYDLVNKKNRDLLDEWADFLYSDDKAESTIHKYREDFKVWAVWNYEKNKDKFFIDITTKDIIKFQGYCLRLGHSPARVRSLRSCLSSLSNYIESVLIDEYPNFRNIVNKVKAPILVKVRKKLILSEEDVENTLNKLVEQDKIQQACYFALAGFSGARKSELLRFKVEYFKEEYIENGLYKTPEKIKTKGRGHLGKQLYKWTIVKNFKPYFDLWMKKREELGIKSDWLFVSQNGKDNYVQAKISTADSWAKTISRVLGQPFYAHSQRHYYCTSLVRAGIPSKIITEIIGWSSEAMIKTYDDIEGSEEFGKYFGDDGIKKQEKKTLADI